MKLKLKGYYVKQTRTNPLQSLLSCWYKEASKTSARPPLPLITIICILLLALTFSFICIQAENPPPMRRFITGIAAPQIKTDEVY